MKFWIATALTISCSAFAAEKHETLNGTGMVKVNGLRCVAYAGGGNGGTMEQRAITELGGQANLTVISADNAILQLRHRRASQKGCDMAAVDAIVMQAGQSFGFLLGVPVSVTRNTSASFKGNEGQCLARVEEIATADTQLGVVFTSAVTEVVPATDCN